MEINHLNLKSNWNHLCQFFPSDLDDLAKKSGAVKRWRNIKSGEELLRLGLVYAVADFSLRSSCAWSALNDFVEIKDTSLLERLKAGVPFFEAILTHLLNFQIKTEPATGPAFRLNDATIISIPGSTGTDWRLHAVYDPVVCRLTNIQITDKKGGERLDLHEYGAGEVVVGDRGLAHARGIHHVASCEAYSLLRMHWQNIRITDENGYRPDLNEVLRRADIGDTGTDIFIPLKGCKPVPARLIIRPLPPVQAQKARRQMHRNAKKKGRTPTGQGLRLAGYFCLLTTLPKERAGDELVMELYRVRWQIELFFKRCKSILRMDNLRAFDEQLTRSYLLCKLIEVVLIELLAGFGESFSPWGVPRRRTCFLT